MVKSMYKHLRKAWQKHKFDKKERNIKWRKETAFKRIDRPTRLDRAREIGYKAKKGFVLVRVGIGRGGRRRPLYGVAGRKPSKTGLTRYTPKKSLKKIAEQRVQKKYPNLEVLGGYYVGEDGVSKWFEIILVDPKNPEIKKDKNVKWITGRQHRRRVLRH